jgi:hypothetical protein
MSYNLPVFEGIGPVTFEPVGGAVAEAHAVLRGDRNDDIWKRMYESALKRAPRG